MVVNLNKAILGLKEVISYIHAYDTTDDTSNYEGLISEHTSVIDKN